MSAAARGQKTAALKAAREKEKENRQMVKSFLEMVNKNKGKKKPETSDDEEEDEEEDDSEAVESEDIVIAKSGAGVRGRPSKPKVEKPQKETKARGRPKKAVVEDDAAMWQREYFKLKAQKLIAEQHAAKPKSKAKKEEVDSDAEEEPPKAKSKAKSKKEETSKASKQPSVMENMHQKYVGLLQTG